MWASLADCSRFFRLQGKRGQTSKFSHSDINGKLGTRDTGLTADSHSRGHLVLEGVRWDPVGAFEENRFPVDAEIKAQARRPGDRLLDKFHAAEVNLQDGTGASQ